MSRMSLIAGNWKMYKAAPEARELARAVVAGVKDTTGVEVLLCPPFASLAAVADELKESAVLLGAQNCFYENEGAYTGEVSAPMLAALGVRYVICGHSERRQYFGDTDEIVNKKVRAVLAAGLTPIFCIGERLEEREAGEGWKDLVRRQLAVGLKDVTTTQMGTLVVAYEPVWAIGTGKTATPAQAGEAHTIIRQKVRELYGAAVAGNFRILYGGSVKPDNIKVLMAEPEVDGALVGGASLKVETFLPLVEGAR